MIKVLLAGDQAPDRAGCRALLEAQPDIEVVGEADDGKQSPCLAAGLRPDVVLTDIRMPRLDALQATWRIGINPELGGAQVVVLTVLKLDEYVFEALRLGAAVFLVKRAEPADLLRAVRVAAAGDALLPPGVTRRLIGEFAARSKEPGSLRIEVLTERGREVLAPVGLGLSKEDTARRLVVSSPTAKTHDSRAMVEPGVRYRAQPVVLAYESALVPAGPGEGQAGLVAVGHVLTLDGVVTSRSGQRGPPPHWAGPLRRRLPAG